MHTLTLWGAAAMAGMVFGALVFGAAKLADIPAHVTAAKASCEARGGVLVLGLSRVQCVSKGVLK